MSTAPGRKCPSKAVNGEWLEAQIWADVEQFLRDPGDVLRQLADKMQGQGDRADEMRDELAGLKLRLGTKQAERDTVVSLFRRGRIDAGTLDRQLDEIAGEEKDLQATIAEYETALADARQAEEKLRSADALLRELRTRLDASLDFATRRRVIETLVERITVNTGTDEDGQPRIEVNVRYRFAEPETLPAVTGITTHTGTDSSPPPA